MTDNDKLVKSLLDRTFFAGWKSDENKYANFSRLEIQVNAFCDLKCKYCYYTQHGKELYPAQIAKPKDVLKNLDILLHWLTENKYKPEIDIFSGELFSQKVGFNVLEMVLNWQIATKNHNNIMIPSNMSFIFDDKKIIEVERFIEKAKKNKIKLSLSASVDGKYCDSNRPFRDGKIRDDEYYDKLFSFCSKHNFSFHPMVYSEGIEKWQDNFLWFQDNFKKHNMPWDSIYILEVRNDNWNVKQIKELYRFYRFLVKYSFENSRVAPQDFPKFTFDKKLFNLFSLFGQTGRGIGCSIQSDIQLRLGDLTHLFCHRASYKHHAMWKFKVENDKIIGVEAIKPELFITMLSSVSSAFPYCETCVLKNLCSGQCLGSMYETNGELFVPIPSVCAAEHAKISAVLDEVYDLGLLPAFYDFSSKKKDLKLYYKNFRKDINWI